MSSGYKYNMRHITKGGYYWSCNQAYKGCKSKVITLEDKVVSIRDTEVSFVSTRKGKRQLIMGNNKFNMIYDNSTRGYWVCNQAPKGCKVAVSTYDNQVVRIKVTFIRNQRGNIGVCVNGYRFKKQSGYREKSYWYCVKREKGCNARLTLKNYALFNSFLIHNHHL